MAAEIYQETQTYVKEMWKSKIERDGPKRTVPSNPHFEDLFFFFRQEVFHLPKDRLFHGGTK
jgi:hypothetical protein